MWGCIWQEAEMHVSKLRMGQGLDGLGVEVRECWGRGEPSWRGSVCG